MSTMFQDVSDLNNAYRNTKGDPLNPDWDKLKAQASNILDEYNELIDDGIDARNMQEVRDAICDILVFTLGLAHIAGIDVEADMKAVDLSNRSKFCEDQKALSQTLEKYANLGVDTYFEGSFPMVCVKSNREQTDVKGKIFRKGKMLKAVSFKEPVFSPLARPYDESAWLMDPFYR